MGTFTALTYKKSTENEVEQFPQSLRCIQRYFHGRQTKKISRKFNSAISRNKASKLAKALLPSKPDVFSSDPGFGLPRRQGRASLDSWEASHRAPKCSTATGQQQLLRVADLSCRHELRSSCSSYNVTTPTTLVHKRTLYWPVEITK